MGLAYAHLATVNASGSGYGLVLNAGYEWRFASHVGVLVGGGIADLRSFEVSSEGSTIDGTGNSICFNLEAGVRYFL